MNSEQALMGGLLQKCGWRVQLDHPCQVRSADLDIWERLLACNFHVLNYEHAGIDFPQRLIRAIISPRTIFTAKAIDNITMQAPIHRSIRRVRVWLNQYLLCFFQLTWWIPVASIVLFSISPALAKQVRRLWRMTRGNQRPL